MTSIDLKSKLSDLRNKGITVLENQFSNDECEKYISEFEKVIEKKINVVIDKRRAGDVAVSFTDNSFAKKYLEWDIKESLKSICEDAWNWKKNNNES